MRSSATPDPIARETPQRAFRLSSYELLLFAVPLLLLVLAGLWQFRALGYSADTATQLALAAHRVQAAEALEFSLLEAESAARAYVLTASDNAARRLFAAQARFAESRDALVHRSTPPADSARAAAVIALAEYRMTFVRRAFELRRSEDHEAIARMLRNPDGPRSMDAARDALRHLRRETEANLARLQAREDLAEQRRLLLVSALLLVCLAAGVSLAAYRARQAMARLRRIGAAHDIALRTLLRGDDQA